jgi:sugar diacid utilization regulator
VAVAQTGPLGIPATPPAAMSAGDAAVAGGTDAVSAEAMSVFSAIALANGNADLRELVMLVAQGVGLLLGAARAAVYLRDEGTGLFVGQCGYGEPGLDAAIRGSVCGQPFDGLTQEIVTTRRPVTISNARLDPRPVRTAVLEWELRSLVGAPFVHGEEVIGLIFIDDGDRPRVFDQRDLRLLEVFGGLVSGVIVRARETERLRDVARTLHGKNKALQVALAFGDRIAQLAADGAGIGEVAATVSQFTGNACAIYDRQGSRRAMAAPGGEGREPSFETTLVGIPGLAAALARTRPRPGHATVIALHREDGSARRLLFMRAPDECPEGGTILLEQSGAQRLNVLDAKVVRRAAAMVDVIVRAEGNEAECLRGLATDLLLGRDDERILARAAQHLIDLAAPRVVCLLGRNTETVEPGPIAAALERALGTLPRLIVGVGPQVAVVLDLDTDAPGPEAIGRVKRALATVVDELPGSNWQAGLSGPCHEADDYKHALAEARQALDACGKAGEAVVAIDELGLGRLLTSEIDSGRAARFARSVMAPLLEDESAGGGVLITTLETFFECGRNIRQTAQRLEVHENTVRYRLGNILRRTGLDVAGNPRDELTVQLALQLLADSQRPSQRGGRFSANAAAPSAASAEWNTGIASTS